MMGWIAASLFGMALTVAVLVAQDRRRPPSAARAEAPPAWDERFRAHLDLKQAEIEGKRWVAPLGGFGKAELTLDLPLQEHLDRELRRYEVPFASVVALDPRSGRVLAYLTHSSANPDAGDLALDATPPAASVFKVITGSALIDAGVLPSSQVCYSGGQHRLDPANLVDHPGKDRSCASLSDAMGGSINAIFAKLALRHLNPEKLTHYAKAFGFGRELPFDLRPATSPVDIPSEKLEYARAAAGFWHSHMSPLHGALIAATIANEGKMPRPFLVERVRSPEGKELYRARPSSLGSVVSPRTARLVGEMMTATITRGTSRSYFYDSRGNPFLPKVEVAGKTGSLSSHDPFRAYSWWVGFAPLKAPRLAIGALVVNTDKWRIKASYLGREALRKHLLPQALAKKAKR